MIVLFQEDADVSLNSPNHVNFPLTRAFVLLMSFFRIVELMCLGKQGCCG